MYRKSTIPQTPPNLFFLALFAGKTAELHEGVKTFEGRSGPTIALPEIPEMQAWKTKVGLDKHNPAHVSAKGKIYNAYFKLNGGTKFSDPKTFLTLTKPEAGDRILIISKKRWDFANKLSADKSIKAEKGTGNANGSVAPGLIILNDGDSVKFIWEGRKYTLSNFEGFAHLVAEKPAPVQKEVKEKPLVVEEIVDNRIKIENKVKVVAKIDLKPKKVKTSEVPTTKPAIKSSKPATGLKKQEYKNVSAKLNLGSIFPEELKALALVGKEVAA